MRFPLFIQMVKQNSSAGFRLLSLLISATLFAPALFAEPFWGSKTSQPIDTAPNKLKPGQFIWKGDVTSFDPVMAVISISEQKVYLYRNDILIGVSTISTGRGGGGRSTPTGTFTVLEKSRYHRSSKYHNAPMPYTHRLTLNGIAMHAGNLPGYPASHGCIRLPSQFARFLFESSSVGMSVMITRNKIATLEPSNLAVQSAVNSKEANAIKTNSSPVPTVISKTDQLEGINAFLSNAPLPQWIEIGIPDYISEDGALLIADASVLEQQITDVVQNAIINNKQNQYSEPQEPDKASSTEFLAEVASLQAEINEMQAQAAKLKKAFADIKKGFN